MADGNPRHGEQGCRRTRQAQVPRGNRVQFRLSDQEYATFQAGARSQGLSRGAFAAQAAMTAARTISTGSGTGAGDGADEQAREAIEKLDHAAGQVHRIGVNLNQAVARLHATGQNPAELLPYARESIRLARRLDEAARAVEEKLR